MEEKVLICPEHPNDHVICLSTNPSHKKTLFCVNCILETDNVTKNDVKAFKVAIDEIYSKLYSKDRLTIDDSSLDPLLEALDTKSDAIRKLTEHIEKEKERISTELDVLARHFVDMIKQTKQDIFYQFETELATLQHNYTNFRYKLTKFSDFDSGSKKKVSYEDFCKELQGINSTDLFEQRWKDLLEDFKETSLYDVYGNKAKRVLTDKLEEYRQMIQAGRKVFPKNFIESGQYYDMAKQELSLVVRNFQKRMAKFNNQILSDENFLKCIHLTGTCNSKILQASDFPILESLSGGPIYNMNLEYRASRDGPRLDSIQSLFNQPMNVILLVKSTNDQIVGFRKIVEQEKKIPGQAPSKPKERKFVFSLTAQSFREERNLNPWEKITGWPSFCLRLPNPVELRVDNCFVEVVSTLSGDKFYGETFNPKEIEAFTLS